MPFLFHPRVFIDSLITKQRNVYAGGYTAGWKKLLKFSNNHSNGYSVFTEVDPSGPTGRPLILFFPDETKPPHPESSSLTFGYHPLSSRNLKCLVVCSEISIKKFRNEKREEKDIDMFNTDDVNVCAMKLFQKKMKGSF